LGFGAFYALNLRKPATKPVVAEQTIAQNPDSTSLAQAGKPKPGPATPSTTTPAAAAETPATPEEVTPAPVKSDAMQAQLNAAPRMGNLKNAPDTSAPPPTSGISMDMGNSASPNPFGAKAGPKVTAAPSNSNKVISVAASIMAGRAISRNPPVYPLFARTARVDGTVVLHATISKAGTISNLSIISGPPMLRQAALDAVKTWRYKPYLLDNEPVEVETTVNVIFVLGG
jgi:protein TonB